MQLTRNDILEKLKEIMQSMYDQAPAGLAEVTEDTRLAEGLGLNSVGMLYMVIIIETSFGIRFDHMELSNFRTVGDVVSYIEEHQP